MNLKSRKILLIQLLILIIFITTWEVFSRLKLIDPFLFSMPTKVLNSLINYLRQGTLFNHLMITCLETMLGLFIGTTLGILIAILLWWNNFLFKIFEPYLIILNALPKTALAPVLIIWLGTGLKGIVGVCVSISLVVTIISLHQAFIEVDEKKIILLKSFKATKKQILCKLIIPSNKEILLNTFKINIGLSFVGVIVGEFIVSKAGIGYLIMYGSQVFKMEIVMMGVIILSLVSFFMYAFVNIIERRWNNK